MKPVYTFQNATRATVAQTAAGPIAKGAFGGIPFPIPKNGAEVMLNTQVHWRGVARNQQSSGYQVTADGRPVLVHTVNVDNAAPYYYQDGKAESFDGVLVGPRRDLGARAACRRSDPGPPVRR